MLPRTTIALALLFIPGLAAAEDLPTAPLTGRVTDSKNGGPVENAQVFVADAAGHEQVLLTDRFGRYALDVLPGTYVVAFAYGQSQTVGHVTVDPDHPAVLDGKIDSRSNEVIVIQEKRQPKVRPRPLNYSSRRAPPYSDEAVEKDAWTRAWMVLDVSPTGEVSRFKFLKRPGYDLEKIASDEVFKLAFSPARDDAGNAVRAWVVWGIEWPSNGWLRTMFGTRTGMPPMVARSAFIPFPARAQSESVPCKGSGPMHLGSMYPTYRDCSKPDLNRMPNEPWVVKP